MNLRDQSASLRYKRVLLKLSGEILRDPSTGDCFNPATLATMAANVKQVAELGCQVAIVLGGGNIFRGLSGAAAGVDRTSGDYMGMLATIINALALQNAIEGLGMPVRVMTAVEMPKVAESYVVRRALRHLNKGRITILAGGTGSPYFSTDTAAALRASELRADVLLKATSVDGVYTADPRRDPTATRYEQLTCQEALEQRLGVMDATAFALCMGNAVPIIVFNFFEPNAFVRVVTGEKVGTLVADNTADQEK